MTKILIIGAGYVGLANAVLLSRNYPVDILDIDISKVDLINKKKSPIFDNDIQEYLSNQDLNLKAINNNKIDYQNYKYIFLALPTDYDDKNDSFSTSLITSKLIEIFRKFHNAIVIIRSTLPIGYCKEISNKIQTDRIIFCPEFLKEGSALKDSLYPSRLIIGGKIDYCKEVLSLFKKTCKLKKLSYLFTTTDQAESIKLFSNTFLAMRIAFFNELDTFCIKHNIEPELVIKGVSLDERIGDYYNNPSFGYGGYCLPKDTKQLLSNFKDLPQDIIKAIVISNNSRKNFISKTLINKNVKTIGIYRLSMKIGSDNFRNSSVIDVLKSLIASKKNKIIIFEPLIKNNSFLSCKVIKDLYEFKSKSNLIIANRFDNQLVDVKEKVFTRDIFGIN